MGDRSYTRFSIPMSAITTPARRRRIASILDEPLGTVIDVLSRTPEPDAAGYDNGTSLRLVHGTVCIVVEYDEWNYAGADLEQELITARVPYLRLNEPGVGYGSTVTLYTGKGEPITLYVSDETSDEVMVPVTIAKGQAILDPSRLQAARTFAKNRQQLFG